MATPDLSSEYPLPYNQFRLFNHSTTTSFALPILHIRYSACQPNCSFLPISIPKTLSTSDIQYFDLYNDLGDVEFKLSDDSICPNKFTVTSNLQSMVVDFSGNTCKILDTEYKFGIESLDFSLISLAGLILILYILTTCGRNYLVAFIRKHRNPNKDQNQYQRLTPNEIENEEENISTNRRDEDLLDTANHDFSNNVGPVGNHDELITYNCNDRIPITDQHRSRAKGFDDENYHQQQQQQQYNYQRNSYPDVLPPNFNAHIPHHLESTFIEENGQFHNTFSNDGVTNKENHNKKLTNQANEKKQALVQEVTKFISEERRLLFVDNLLGLGLLILIYSEFGGGGYWLFQVSYWGYRF